MLCGLANKNSNKILGFPGGSDGKESTFNAGDPCSIPESRKNPLEKGIATHSSILAGIIPWTTESGRLLSTGLQSWT